MCALPESNDVDIHSCTSESCKKACQGETVHETKEENGDDNTKPLPTAEEHARQLSSLLNYQSVTTLPRPQGEKIDLMSSTQSSLMPRGGFSTPTKEKYSITTNTLMKVSSAAKNVAQIGSGNELFEMKFSVEKCHNFWQLLTAGDNESSDTSPERNAWFSYRCFGTVVQSEIFTISETMQPNRVNFTPTMNSFRIRSSVPELMHHFSERKNATWRIHLCTDGKVLGTSIVDIHQFFTFEKEGDFEGRMVQSEYVLKSRSTNATKEECDNRDCPRIVVRLCIDRDLRSCCSDIDASASKTQELKDNAHGKHIATVYSSTSSQTTKTASVERASSPLRDLSNEKGPSDCDDRLLFKEKEKQLNTKEAELSKKEKEIHELATSLENKRCQWEQWRHRQELEWHEKLRNREAAMMRAVEERVSIIERERLSSMESSKNEYEKLEARLRKALIEVEAKERHLKDIELGHQNERKRKLAEIELREKLMKEELKHSIEIERARVNAAVEQAVAAEKAAAAANKKVKQTEAEMDHLREQHRKTPEVTLMHQMAELKGQLAESERRIETVRAEKNQVTSEKEHFRSDVHKLARALRQERQKAKAIKENSNQQVRLSYDSNEKSFVVGGGQDEIQRILGDLSKISQVKGHGGGQSPICQSPMVDPMINRGSGMVHTNNAPPMPSPQPSRPSQMKTHSPMFKAHTPQQHYMHPVFGMEAAQGGIDLDNRTTTPGLVS